MENVIELTTKQKSDKKYYHRKKTTDKTYLTREAARFKKLKAEKPEIFMCSAAKARAKMYNLPFNITKDDICIPKYCPALGVELKVAEGRMKPNSPSLDKIIPSLGYVKGNIQVLSLKANLMKQNASPYELVAFAHWILETYKD